MNWGKEIRQMNWLVSWWHVRPGNPFSIFFFFFGVEGVKEYCIRTVQPPGVRKAETV